MNAFFVLWKEIWSMGARMCYKLDEGKVQDLLIRKQLRNKELHARTGICYASFSNALHGRPILQNTALKIADALNVTLYEIV